MCSQFDINLTIISLLLFTAVVFGLIFYILKRISCPSSVNENYVNHKPVQFTEETAISKDNLTMIKGIGPKIQTILNENGIFSFYQIANWSEENIQWIEKNLAFPNRIKREEWIEQAKILSSGKSTEFSQRVQRGEIYTNN